MTDEIKPHFYHPSTMHMGDCSTCGNVADVWWHIDQPSFRAREVSFEYLNHAGKQERRYALPIALWYGSTQWHPTPGWLLKGFDTAKRIKPEDGIRDFSVQDMGPARPVLVHCTKDRPWGLLKNDWQRIVHDDAHEVGEQEGGWPGGDIATYECPNCKHRWTAELPQ